MNALPARKDSARNWFETLRDRICAALEEIEVNPLILTPDAAVAVDAVIWEEAE